MHLLCENNGWCCWNDKADEDSHFHGSDEISKNDEWRMQKSRSVQMKKRNKKLYLP
jgi:hypothetical protein